MEIHYFFILVTSLASLVMTQRLSSETCDRQRRFAVVRGDADVMLAGIFPIRTSGNNGYGCGPIGADNFRMLTYEAARFAVNRINDVNFIPGLTLGLKAYDSCSNPNVGMSALDDFFQESSGWQCRLNTSQITVGAVGGYFSDVTEQTAKYLEYSGIGDVAFASNSARLSDKSQYPNLLLTGASMSNLVEVITATLGALRWTRVGVVYSEDDFGTNLFSVLKKDGHIAGICVAEGAAIPVGNTNRDKLNSELQRLVNSGVQAIVLAVRQPDVTNVLQTLDRILPSNSNIQIISTFSLSGSSNLLPGTISVQQEEPAVPEFINHMSQIDPRFPPASNPWFRDWYMRRFSCRLPGATSQDVRNFRFCNALTQEQRRNAYLSELDHSAYREVIKAVYAFAAAVRQAKEAMCGRGARGLCQGLVGLSQDSFFQNYLRGITYTFLSGDGIPSMTESVIDFNENGEIGHGHRFTIKNYNRLGQLSYKPVGNYTSGRLQLDRSGITVYDRRGFRTLTSVPELECSGDQCGACLTYEDLQYWYTQGDVIVVGLTSLHKPGSGTSTCGTLDIMNSFRALAFQQAVNVQNDGNSPIRVGSLLVDVCGSEARLSDFLDRFYSGSLLLRDSSNKVIDPTRVVGTIDMLDDNMARSAAQYSNQLKSPIIGTVASDIELSDNETFPFYSQRIPTDDKEAEAIAYFLRHMGWTYIQTINSGDTYGRVGIAALRRATDAVSVCIAQSLELGLDGNGAVIVRRLQQQPNAPVVVVFGSASTTAEILRAIQNAGASRSFVVITTDWVESSESPEFASAAGRTFTVRISGKSNQRYESYLRQLNPSQTETRYVRELYQRAFRCQISSTSQTCNTTLTVLDSPSYNDRVKGSTEFVIRAVNLLGNNLLTSYREVCTNCGKSFDSAELRKTLQKNLVKEAGSAEGTFHVLGYRIQSGENLSKVAEYSPERFTMIVPPASLRSRLGLSENVATCQGFCGQCSYLVKRHPYIHEPGDIMIGSLVGIMNTGKDRFECVRERLGSGYQHAAAILYALEQLNSGEGPVRLNNVTFGTVVLDDCNNDRRAVGLVNEVYSGMAPVPELSRLDQVPLYAWITHSQSNVFPVASNLQSFQTPLVASEASSIGEADISRSSMLFSTAAIFNQKAVTIVRILRSRGYRYFQALYSDDLAGRQGLEILRKVASEEGVCLVKAVEISGDLASRLQTLASDRAKVVVVLAESLRYAERLQMAANSVPATRGLLFVTMAPMRFSGKPIADNVISIQLEPTEIPGFQDFLSARSEDSDGFYRSYYQSVFNCDLPGSSEYNKSCAVEANRPLPADREVEPTVNAVYALGVAVHQTLQVKCGINYNGVCADFRTARDTNRRISENLVQVSFDTPGGGTFGFAGRRVNQVFDVSLEEEDRSVKIGSFEGGRLLISREDLLQRFSSIQSSCKQPCLSCRPQSFFDYVPGDVYIAGIFNIHYKSVEPFSCGKIKTIFGYQSLEAFKYAIDKVNRREGQFSGMLNGVTLGGLGLDGCDSAVRTAYLAANIHNGETTLSKNGTDILPDEIVGYIAARESDQSKHLARVLNTMDIPQISYGSTSIELNDRLRYPWFARTVPIDDKQSDAILAFLGKYNLRYVQVLQSPTSYGEISSRVFLQKATTSRVCVAQRVTFRDKGAVTKESATEAVIALLENPTANVIVVFADIGYINAFLRAVKRTPAAKGKFLFIGTVSWNRNEVLLEGVEDVAHGSVIFNVEKVDIAQFDRYLEKKSLASERDNTWFQEYYETIHNCLVTSIENRIGGRGQCDRRHQNIVTSRNYLQDPDVLHVTNAVYAAAYGIDYALRRLCGQNYTGVCRQFRERESRRELMFEGAVRARFQDEAFTTFQFTAERSGNKGYTLYSIEPPSTGSSYNYKDIGKFSDAGLDIRGFETSWNGSCDRPETCNECPGVRDQTVRLHRWQRGNSASSAQNRVVPTIVSVVDLHEALEADEFRCGAMRHKSGFDNALAFIYTLDKLINPVKSGFEIDGVVLDTCSRSVRLYPELLGLIRGNGYCSGQSRLGIGGDLSSLMGVVTHGEDNTRVTNRVLTPLAVTSVSPNAVSPALSNIEEYPYFLRTKPPYDVEGAAILDLLRSMGWTYISVVYSGDPRGVAINNYMLKNALGDGSEEQAICIGTSLMLGTGHDQSVANRYVSVLDDQGKRGSRVAVLLTSPKHSEMLLQGLREVQPDTQIVLVGLQDWGLSKEAFAALGEYLVSGISLRTLSPQVPDFLRYKASMNYPDADQFGLPKEWFDEHYQHAHGCYLRNTSVPQVSLYNRPCDETERLNAETMEHDPDVFHTIIATYTLATGLNELLRTCGDQTFEECVARNTTLRSPIFQNVWNTEWPEILDTLGISRAEVGEFQFEYTPGRYGNTGFLVYSVDRSSDTGEPFYQRIGRWNGTVMMDNNATYTGANGLLIESSCYGRLSCTCQFLGGEAAAATGVDKWGEAMLLPRNYYMLERHEEGGTVTYERLIEWPLWAVIIAILTVIMILITLFVFIVLLFFYPVRSGTTVLGFMLLLGILGIFLINFAFFVPASAASCGARRFVMGVVYAICFAALLVKAVDNWRYKWDDYDMGKRKYKGVTSSCSLLLIALALVAIQVLIAIVWLVITAPGATLVSIAPPPHDFWWCNPPLLYDIGLVLSFIFVILLLVATIIFATVSFLKDINYFESRWLLASCLCTAAIFLAWMIISTMATAPYRDVTVAIANLLNGTILLIFFPLRKAWLVYRRHRGDDLYESRSKLSDMNMSATEHMEMSEQRRALERERERQREMAAQRSMLGADQSFIHSAGHQSVIYSQPRNAYAGSTMNRSVVSESAVAGNLRQRAGHDYRTAASAENIHHTEYSNGRAQTSEAPSVVDLRKERKTTTSVVKKTTEERIEQSGAARARVGRIDDGPDPVIVTDLLEEKVERGPDDHFILIPPKPYIYETEVKTTKTYKEDLPDDYIPSNLSASYEVDELSFDPNIQSQRTEWHRQETRTGDTVNVPIRRADGPPSKSRSSSSASSFTSSRLDRPVMRSREADLVLDSPLMEMDRDVDLLMEFEDPKDGKVDRQTKKTTVVETDDHGTTKKTTTVEETAYIEY